MGRKVIDLTGKRFVRLVVLFEDGRNKAGSARWLCLCDCGTIKSFNAYDLKRGDSTSCGCFQRENLITHGLSKHPLYNIWCNMISRCYKPKDAGYKNYGGRGISVCSEWHHDFTAFYHWGLSNGWEKGLTIDRIKNDGNYEPGNCQFISRGLNAVKQRALRSTNTSGYKGVFWSKCSQKYQAQITISGESIYLGLFNNPRAAALVYDKVARHAGDNRSLNFG